MTKKDYAELIIDSQVWNGNRSIKWLCNNFKKSELRDLYHDVMMAETEYLDSVYGS